MSIETIAETELPSQNGLKFKLGRRSPSSQKVPSPLYCTFFLIVCIILGEVFEGFILHSIDTYIPHSFLVLFDIGSMVVIVLPAFYFFVYRPMKLYEQTKVAAEEEIKFLSRQLMTLGDKEKRAVARDLHDQFGESLSILQFSLETLRAGLPTLNHDQAAQCDDLVETISRLGTMVKNVSAHLSPSQLDDLGLIPTLEWAIKDIQEKGASFNVDFEIDGMDKRLPYQVEIALYRIFQESLNNITKHADASRVKIFLQEKPTQISLSVQDNGVGFGDPVPINVTSFHRGIGLLGMRERIEDLGGAFNLSTAPGKGTIVHVDLPRP